MRPKLLPKNNNEKLNSKVGKTLTYKELIELFANKPTRIKALIS